MLNDQKQDVVMEEPNVGWEAELGEEMAAQQAPEEAQECGNDQQQVREEPLEKFALEYFPSSMANYLAQREKQKAAVSFEESIYPIQLAKTLFARPEMPVRSYCEDFIYAGGLTTIAAAPKSGKSTLMWYVLNAISQGSEVFGRKCTKGKVLYISEQNEACFRDQAKNVPFLKEDSELGILLAECNTTPIPGKPGDFHYISDWDSQLAFWQDRIKAFDADVVVIDTLGAFFHLPPNGENDNGIMQERMAELRSLFNLKKHMAIVLVHHNRKEGDQPKREESLYPSLQSIRRASAIAGAADHVICLGASNDPRDANRYLAFHGRYVASNGMRMKVQLNRETREYKVVSTDRTSDSEEVYLPRMEEIRRINESKLRAALPARPEEARSIKELIALTKLSGRTLTDLLKKGLSAPFSGRGVKGDPKRFWLNDSILPAAKA